MLAPRSPRPSEHPWSAPACLRAARTAEARGRVQGAEEFARRGLRVVGEPAPGEAESAEVVRVELLRVLARCHRGSGRVEEARQALRAACRYALTIGDRRPWAAVVGDLAEAEPDPTGVSRRVLVDLEAALAVLDPEGGAVPPVAGVDPQAPRLAALLALAVAMDDPARALRLAGRARRLAAAARSAEASGATASIPALVEGIAVLLGAAGPSVGPVARPGPDRGPGANALVAACSALRSGDRGTLSASARWATKTRSRGVADTVLSSLPSTLAILAPPAGPGGPVAAPLPSTRLGRAAELVSLLGLWLASGPAAPLPDALVAEPAGSGSARGGLARAVRLATDGSGAGRSGAGGWGPDAVAPPDWADDVVTCAEALAAAVSGDRPGCRRALDALAGREGELATAVLGVLGPVGWFTAQARLALGDQAGAARDLAAAVQVCRDAGAHSWLDRCLADEVVLRGETPVAATPRLTGRAREVLARAAEGLSNDEIAACLGLRVSTVERHLTNAYRLLGVRNRAQAVAAVLAVEGLDPARRGDLTCSFPRTGLDSNPDQATG